MARPARASIDVETPRRLLDAALDLFAETGFSAARLADIAARAGITRPSLLYHFDSKERLFAATLERAFSELTEVLRLATRGPSPFEEKLRALSVGFVEFIDARPALARLLAREVVAGAGPGRALLLTQAVPVLEGVLRFVKRAGRGHLAAGAEPRAVLMAAIANAHLRAASGELRARLWGEADPTWPLVATLLASPAGDAPARAASHPPRSPR